MGALDYTMNAIQSGQISELQDKVKELEEKTQILYDWVQHLRKENETLHDRISRRVRTERNRDMERRPDHRLLFPILGDEND